MERRKGLLPSNVTGYVLIDERTLLANTLALYKVCEQVADKYPAIEPHEIAQLHAAIATEITARMSEQEIKSKIQGLLDAANRLENNGLIVTK